MKTADYHFHLPEESIAYRPADQRDGGRLLVLSRDGEIDHAFFRDLPLYLNAGDMLIVNNTKVFPARLPGRRRSGAPFDMLFVEEISPVLWKILSKGNYSGPVTLADDTVVFVREGRTVEFPPGTNVRDVLWKTGLMPLPPYIRRRPDDHDRERYQTVYAEIEGSIAAPTAGLHFSEEVFSSLRSKGILIRSLTLHVGTGTFRPVKVESLENHVMEEEYFEINASLFDEIAETKKAGGKLVAVGTTTTRALEGYSSETSRNITKNGIISGTTGIFIREGHRFQIVDSLITNFHLPGSTPLVLTAALTGRENLLRAYESALSLGYRFFSYGDAMLVL